MRRPQAAAHIPCCADGSGREEDKRTLLNPKVGDVTVDGDRATARVEKLAEPVPLRRVEEKWRVERSTFEVER